MDLNCSLYAFLLGLCYMTFGRAPWFSQSGVLRTDCQRKPLSTEAAGRTCADTLSHVDGLAVFS